MANLYSLLNLDHPTSNTYPHRYSNEQMTGGIGKAIVGIGDNRYDTYHEIKSNENKEVKIYIDTKNDGTGEARTFTHIFLKCKGVESYKLYLGNNTQPFSYGLPPTDFVQEIDDVVITRTGPYQHNLSVIGHLLKLTEVNQKIITLEFEPIENTTIEIYQILVLHHELYLDSEAFTDIQPVNEDRTGGIHTAIDGTQTRYTSLGDRDKLQIQYEKPVITGIRELQERQRSYLPDSAENPIVKVKQPIELINELYYFKHRFSSFVFEREYSRFQDTIIAEPWDSDGSYSIDDEVEYAGFYFRKKDETSSDKHPLIHDSGWTITHNPLVETIETQIFPDMVFLALFGNTDFDAPYFSTVKGNGFQTSFQISES